MNKILLIKKTIFQLMHKPCPLCVLNVYDVPILLKVNICPYILEEQASHSKPFSWHCLVFVSINSTEYCFGFVFCLCFIMFCCCYRGVFVYQYDKTNSIPILSWSKCFAEITACFTDRSIDSDVCTNQADSEGR